MLGLTVLTLAVAGVAQAHEFAPGWGYGFIDDNPFNDPAAGGALLPATAVYPRGYIRDTLVDGKDVQLQVNVFTPGNPNTVTSYRVTEGDFENIPIDRRLDISPLPVGYVKYELCKFDPTTGITEECDTALRISRPSPQPAPTPVPATPVDADGDGTPVPADCWDQNATVHPGGKEIPGNGLDDDCVGGDAPGRLAATFRNKWTAAHGRVRVDALRVLDAPDGARVEVSCSGKHCPFRRKKVTSVNAKGDAFLVKYFKHRLRPPVTIDVRVTYPNMVGKLARFKMRHATVPSMRRYCLPPGTTKPKRC